jgi:hypothetical protein
MIIQSIVILLIILIISNVILGFYNKLYPPCFDANEYFKNARTLPDGVSSDLGSIASGTDRNYIGAARVSTGKAGTIGLRSWSSTYSDPNTIEDLVNPVISDAEEQDRMECEGGMCSIKTAKVSKEAYDAISAAFPASSQQESGNKKVTSKVKGYTGEFEIDFEGIKANNYTNKKNGGKRPTGFKHSTETDGYQDDTGVGMF